MDKSTLIFSYLLLPFDFKAMDWEATERQTWLNFQVLEKNLRFEFASKKRNKSCNHCFIFITTKVDKIRMRTIYQKIYLIKITYWRYLMQFKCKNKPSIILMGIALSWPTFLINRLQRKYDSTGRWYNYNIY